MIMKRDHYVKMVYEQLNDEKYCKRVDAKHDKKVLTSLKKLVQRYDEILTEKENRSQKKCSRFNFTACLLNEFPLNISLREQYHSRGNTKGVQMVFHKEKPVRSP